uniref:Uncharacterized protein n=1 Tax=Glossina pallidipes TaxID=7398 RepID=A0A1B0ADF8_GLOPL
MSPLYNVKRKVSFADLFDKQLNNPAASNFSCVPCGPVQFDVSSASGIFLPTTIMHYIQVTAVIISSSIIYNEKSTHRSAMKTLKLQVDQLDDRLTANHNQNH